MLMRNCIMASCYDSTMGTPETLSYLLQVMQRTIKFPAQEVWHAARDLYTGKQRASSIRCSLENPWRQQGH